MVVVLVAVVVVGVVDVVVCLFFTLGLKFATMVHVSDQLEENTLIICAYKYVLSQPAAYIHE